MSRVHAPFKCDIPWVLLALLTLFSVLTPSVQRLFFMTLSVCHPVQGSTRRKQERKWLPPCPSSHHVQCVSLVGSQAVLFSLSLHNGATWELLKTPVPGLHPRPIKSKSWGLGISYEDFLKSWCRGSSENKDLCLAILEFCRMVLVLLHLFPLGGDFVFSLNDAYDCFFENILFYL